MVQQPKSLDAAIALARLQEEAMAMTKEPIRSASGLAPSSGGHPYGRGPPRTAMPLPPPPPVGRTPGPPQGGRSDDRCTANAPLASAMEDKIAALRAYRRVCGLCYTCGERWARDHTSGPTVQLHVVEELLGLLNSEMDSNSSLDHQGTELSAISDAASQGHEPPLKFRLQGCIHEQPVLMLVDFGSTHSFISEAVASAWPEVRQCHPTQVKVADGGLLHCDLEAPNCRWSAQGAEFVTTLCMLHLGCYDVI
jgi:hypothetical protein